MAKKDPADYTVEEKLKTLYELQTILSEIDKIKILRGELPLEVKDLEDEIVGLGTRIENINGEIKTVRENIVAFREEMEKAKANIEKYTADQNNVRNNREFDLLNKEIEYNNLVIEHDVSLPLMTSASSAEINKKRTDALQITWTSALFFFF